VSAQVGFSFVVLFLAGLMLLTFQNLARLDPGFDKTGLILFSFEARDSEKDPTRTPQLEQQLQDHVRRLNGVKSASFSSWSLFGGSRWSGRVRLPGREQDPRPVYYLTVSPRFFETMGIHMLDGRDFEPRDAELEELDAVIVNETFVRQFFPGEKPLGKNFGRVDPSEVLPQEIVGIVRDAKYTSLRDPAPPTVYLPRRGGSYGVLQVRTALDPLALVPVLNEEVRRVHPSFRITDVTLQSTLIDNTLLRERLLALLSGFFGLIAVVLAAVGLYGVLNYSVVRRTKEIGIRVALGARRRAVVTLVISDISLLVASGLAAGVGAGFWLAQFVATLLFEVQPSDFWSLALPLACLLAAAALAAVPPALRAARVDPMVALRYE
jgi:predicted permease